MEPSSRQVTKTSGQVPLAQFGLQLSASGSFSVAVVDVMVLAVRKVIVRIRITRAWDVAGFPLAKLDEGETLEMPARVAIYFLAMRCAQCDERADQPGRRSPVMPRHHELGASM